LQKKDVYYLNNTVFSFYTEPDESKTIDLVDTILNSPQKLGGNAIPILELKQLPVQGTSTENFTWFRIKLNEKKVWIKLLNEKDFFKQNNYDKPIDEWIKEPLDFVPDEFFDIINNSGIGIFDKNKIEIIKNKKIQITGEIIDPQNVYLKIYACNYNGKNGYLIMNGILDIPTYLSDTPTSISIIGDTIYVSDKSGLQLKKSPNSPGENIQLLPLNSELSILEETNKSETINNISGKWLKVKFDNQEGYVFDGFISYQRTVIDTPQDSTQSNTCKEDDPECYKNRCAQYGNSDDCKRASELAEKNTLQHNCNMCCQSSNTKEEHEKCWNSCQASGGQCN
jgi:hypothetical protein